MIFLKEKFISIQGEGLNIGRPALFIRTAYCNLRCPWCDTKYSWTSGKPIGIDELAREISSSGVSLVVITGGEPLIYSYEIAQLLMILRDEGYEGTIQIETNGSIEPKPLKNLDNYVLTLSPKVTCNYKVYFIDTLRRLLNQYRVLELKLVVTKNDIRCLKSFLWELGTIEVPVILQPLHRTNKNYADETRELVEFILSDKELRGRVRVIPQLHKLIGVK